MHASKRRLAGEPGRITMGICFYCADGLSDSSHETVRYPNANQNLNWDDSTTFRHVNGVTVYEQQEPDSKHATYMVSAAVHASPEDCMKVCHRPAAQSWQPACITGISLHICTLMLLQTDTTSISHCKSATLSKSGRNPT